MGFLKFVIPFVGGAMTVAAGIAAKKKLEEKSKESVEIDAEFEEKTEHENNGGSPE